MHICQRNVGQSVLLLSDFRPEVSVSHLFRRLEIAEMPIRVFGGIANAMHAAADRKRLPGLSE